jgi:8-oxo-dGTP diphosphatase
MPEIHDAQETLRDIYAGTAHTVVTKWIHEMQKAKRIIAAVITKGDTFLIAQRAKKDALYEKWEFPGGKVEAGETDHECLRRELTEEFGIHTEVGDYFCTSLFEYKGEPMEMIVYYVHSYTGEFTLYDHKQIKWVHCKELSQYDFPDADKPIIDKLLAGSLKSNSLKKF